MSKFEIREEELDNVTGGKITYTWDDTTKKGTIGINGNNNFTLLDKAAFVSYYNSVKDQTPKPKDSAILNALLAKGIIK